jgi:hypothetical protein
MLREMCFVVFKLLRELAISLNKWWAKFWK